MTSLSERPLAAKTAALTYPRETSQGRRGPATPPSPSTPPPAGPTCWPDSPRWAFYEQALEVDPEFDNAKRMLEQIRSQTD